MRSVRATDFSSAREQFVTNVALASTTTAPLKHLVRVHPVLACCYEHCSSYCRHTAASAGTSSEGTAAAHHPARVRQGGAAVPGGAVGLSTLSAAHDRAGVVGPRIPGHERRIRQAKFPVIKTMDSFDFLAMMSCAGCEHAVGNCSFVLAIQCRSW
jgi:hypothetical protein